MSARRNQTGAKVRRAIPQKFEDPTIPVKSRKHRFAKATPEMLALAADALAGGFPVKHCPPPHSPKSQDARFEKGPPRRYV
jgi:hypothetical protein